MAGIYDQIPSLSIAFKDPTRKSTRPSTWVLPEISVSKFEALSKIVEIRNEDNPNLPRITLIPFGSLALGLPSYADDILECVVFGNVSNENYIDLFWEAVDKITGHMRQSMVVYEIVEYPMSMILLSFEGQLFRLKYHRYDDVMREYPDILSTPESFLDNDTNEAQNLIRRIKAGEKLRRESIEPLPAVIEAYGYIKRWVKVRGITELPDAKILQHLQRSRSDFVSSGNTVNPNTTQLLIKFFQHDAHIYDKIIDKSKIMDFEGYTLAQWGELVSALDTLPLQDKMLPFSQAFIRVAITYSGPSRMQAGAWVSMVERRIAKLGERLQKAVSDESVVHLWPYRLARQPPSSSVNETVYEGSYFIGISSIPTSEDWGTIHEFVRKWEEQAKGDQLTSKEHCFIQILIEKSSDIAKEDLTTCTAKFQRKPLTGDETSSKRNKKDGILPLRHKQVSKKQTISHLQGDHEKGKRFRTAAEVLNRLKHDDSWNIDEFVIGYEDRHSAEMQEKPAGDWVRETTAEEFIPEHRIEYFKRNNSDGSEYMWHKSKRVDRIFRGMDS